MLGGLVAVLDEELLDELVETVVGTVAVLVTVAVVVAVTEVVVVLLLLDVVVGLELRQSRGASSLIVSAPCPRFWIKVVLTLRGSEPTRSLKRREATAADEHFPEATAEEIELSCALRLLA